MLFLTNQMLTWFFFRSKLLVCISSPIPTSDFPFLTCNIRPTSITKFPKFPIHFSRFLYIREQTFLTIHWIQICSFFTNLFIFHRSPHWYQSSFVYKTLGKINTVTRNQYFHSRYLGCGESSILKSSLIILTVLSCFHLYQTIENHHLHRSHIFFL